MSFNEVMNIYDLRKIITANMENFYSLLYVDQRQLSFVKEYIKVKSSTLEIPEEFILYEFILKLKFNSRKSNVNVLINNFSNTFIKLILGANILYRSDAFIIASHNNNYEIMKYLIDFDEKECQLSIIIYNKQYEMLRYIVHQRLYTFSYTRFLNEIILIIIMQDDVEALKIIIDKILNRKDHYYFIDLARKTNKTKIIKYLDELNL